MAARRRPSDAWRHDPARRHLFTAIDHVGIAVPDLDEAIAFYRDTFGMETVHEETNEEQGVREAMVAVGDSGSCIQLLAPLPETRRSRSSSTAPARACSSSPTASRTSTRSRHPARARRPPAVRRAAARHVGSRVNFVHPQGRRGVLVELVEPAREAAGH
jgi:methylmalonyl-CoA/ethylmalonyl-CoA epimerase